MRRTKTLAFSEERQAEMLEWITTINLNPLLKERGIGLSYLHSFIKGVARNESKYAACAEVIALAKEAYDKKMAAVHMVNSL